MTGAVHEVTSVSDLWDLELFRPRLASVAPGEAFLILDSGNSELYRVSNRGVDTIARLGSGPGELRGPSAVGWNSTDSTVVVVDDGNGRILFLSADEERNRSLPYARGATNADFSFTERLLFASTYATQFRWSSGSPVVPEDSLVTIASLEDGTVWHRLGSPRAFPGRLLKIVANNVRVAFDAQMHGLWLSWPAEPLLVFYSLSEGPELTRSWTVPLEFEPEAPREYTSSSSPLPTYDLQVVISDLTVAEEHLILLVPIGPKFGNLSAPDHVPSPQALYVMTRAGELRCRIPLPVTGTQVEWEADGMVLLADIRSGDIYRIRFRCP